MDFSAQDTAFATATGTVLAGIGKHYALAQGGAQYSFSFIYQEGFIACLHADFELLHTHLQKRPPIVADQEQKPKYLWGNSIFFLAMIVQIRQNSGMGTLRLLYRIPWTLVHVLLGLPLTLFSIATPVGTLRIGKKTLDDIMLNWWSGTTCRIFGLQRRIQGRFPPGAQLVVANHISWLDILLLHSVSPMGFVAKAEIQNWKLVGWMASMGGTVFHHRGSHDSSSGVSTVMVRRLEQGKKVAVFAEGGILPGHGIKHFHARMFAAAIETGLPVQPVMIRYLRDGQHHRDMTFLRGENLVANLFRLLRQAGCVAEVTILPPICPAGKRRRELAKESEAAIRAAFEGKIDFAGGNPVHG